MRIKFRNSHGFTLIELMVVISIVAILVGGALAGYGNFSNKNLLKQTALTLKNNLRLIQAQASSGKKKSSLCTSLLSYQIKFETSQYKMALNCESEGIVDEVTVAFPDGITMPEPPDPNIIYFYVLSKGTNISGFKSLILSGVAGTYRLDVTDSGDIVDINSL